MGVMSHGSRRQALIKGLSYHGGRVASGDGSRVAFVDVDGFMDVFLDK
jgi:hypothetical protein